MELYLENVNTRARPEGVTNDDGTRFLTPWNKHGFQWRLADKRHRSSEEHPVQGELVDTLVIGVADVKVTVVVDRQTFRFQLPAHSRELSLHTPFQLICERIVGLDPISKLTGDQQLLGSKGRETHAVVEVLRVDREHNVGYSCKYRWVGAAVKPNDLLWFSGIVHQQQSAGWRGGAQFSRIELFSLVSVTNLSQIVRVIKIDDPLKSAVKNDKYEG